jgi:hypothetical protein
MMHENLDLSDINQVLHVVRNPYGWNEHVVRDARLKLADEFERLRAEVEALRADAERYRAMRREKGGMMRDIDKAIRLINDWNHDKEHATHGHAVWVGLKLIHEIEQLRAEVDALRGVHEAATRVFKFHAVNKRNFFMAFCDLESNLDRVAEIDAARKGE